MFGVYHEGSLQGTTLLTSITVGGLLPCQQYQAKVEALCGDGVFMSAMAVTAHTGPHGVSDLRYHSIDSTARWMPHTTHQPAVAFFYELSLDNGTTMLSSRVADPELRLPRLEKGKTYVLDVWEECGSHWESERSLVWLQGDDSSAGLQMRAAGHVPDEELQFDFALLGLTMVVPWSLPEELLDEASEPRAKMEKIYKDKLQELFKDFSQPARVELASFEPADEPDKTEVQFVSFGASQPEGDVPLSIEDQLDYIHTLKTDTVTVTDGVIYWNGPDLCASSKPPPCPRNSLCINTLGSYSCVCHHGYYDVSAVISPPAASRPVCNEKGLFSQCLGKMVTGGIAKPYLVLSLGGEVDVRLNDGRCAVDESEMMFHFRTSRKASECGTQRRVNKTHIQLQNTLTVTLTRLQTISRWDPKFVWKCVYPRHYVRNAQVSVDTEWLASISLMEFNSSLQLGLTMTLHTNESFASSYRDAVTMELEDTLFFQVTLQTNNSFASDVLLQVESCWATESTDPQDAVQGVLLQDGCAVDDTFHWLSVNGLAQTSRFSIQMFTMPKGLPLYIHCQANICGHDEDCIKNCSSQRRPKRSVSRAGRDGKRAAVVSAGPLLVLNSRGASAGPPPDWAVIPTVAGLIGFLGATVLSVSVTKAIVTYYERLQLQ
ncbi:zona pellucida sperm-binding protein 4-like [Cyclopterus lumpus]|uniref:zona pellucida sperm-binding protein 4-like n=1 Tax=Cyclopterus lumpus TaxID=8103 RepID=UPI0014869C86|nr:zona pellucida sperm-binding protein 4-like [Cyclopterus lumpus]